MVLFRKGIFLTQFPVYSLNSSVSGKFVFEKCVRNLHELIDDTGFKVNNKTLKYNKKVLLDNLKCLNQSNSSSPITSEFIKLLSKLESIKFVEKLDDNYDLKTLSCFLSYKLNIIQSLIPYIHTLNTLQQDDSVLRLKYEIINNDLLQYLFRLVVTNLDNLDSEILINYLNFLLEIGLKDANPLILKLYTCTLNALDRGNYFEDERLITKLKLTSNLVCKADLVDKVDGTDLNHLINELLLDSLSTSTVFYKCFNEISHLTHGIKCVNNDYIYNFINKVSNYVYILDNNELLTLLYVLLKMNCVESKLFNRMLQSVVYKFGSFNNEQFDTLITILSSYKQYFKLNCTDLCENLYAECGNMLLNMVKRCFEEKFVNLNINSALPTLTYLLQLTNSNKIKILMLKKLDKNSVNQLDFPRFRQLLIVLKRLNLVKNREIVAQLVENYFNDRVLPLFNTVDGKLPKIDEDVKNILMSLSDFIKIKHYSKYINSIIMNYFKNIEDCEMSEISDEMVFLINLCIKNKVYKFNNLTTELVLKFFNKPVNFMNLSTNSNVLYGYDVILDGIEHCNLTYECVSDMSNKVFDAIYNFLRGKNKINLKLISKLLRFSSNTRIFPEPLTQYILHGMTNILVLYLKCVYLLKIEVNIDKLDHIYRRIIGGLECVNNFNKIVEELRILLLMLKFDDFRVYGSVMSRSDPELRVKLTESGQIVKANGGRSYKNLERCLIDELKLEDLKNYYKVEEFVLDFYSEKTNQAIHLLKSNQYSNFTIN